MTEQQQNLKNETFLKIYETLAAKHSTSAENIMLMLKDRTISYKDTPSSINLKIYDIIGQFLCQFKSSFI